MSEIIGSAGLPVLDSSPGSNAPTPSQGSAFLNHAQFNQLLAQVGQNLIWRKATACPCLITANGQYQPNPVCVYCSGKGHVWGDGIHSIAGVISTAVAQKIFPMGYIEMGDLALSIPENSPLYDISSYDRVRTIDRTEPFSMVVVAPVNTLDQYTIERIDGVAWIDDDGNWVNGTVPAIVDNMLIWSGTVPPDGVQFTITGRRFIEYYCYQDQPLDRPAQFGERLPRRVVLKRFDSLAR